MHLPARALIPLAPLLAASLLACGGTTTPGQTSGTTGAGGSSAASTASATTGGTGGGGGAGGGSGGGGGAPSLPMEGCIPTPSPGMPVMDPNGPYYHQVVLAHTMDGITLQGDHQILDHASVPDGTRMADGSARVYYVDGAKSTLAVARIEGDQATPLGPITLGGVQAPGGVVDPDVQLVGGKVRLYYLGGFGPPNSGKPRGICIAESSDGVTFDILGRALELPSMPMITDPSVIHLTSGKWLMALSQGQQTILARSDDGYTFTQGETLNYGGVPELSLLDDGKVRLYVCAMGIESYLSDTEGMSWNKEAKVLLGSPGKAGCDPSRVAGTDLFLYKTF
ncbi:MAG: hypothetical protein U0359_09765 [Byssovorax sp.]